MITGRLSHSPTSFREFQHQQPQHEAWANQQNQNPWCQRPSTAHARSRDRFARVLPQPARSTPTRMITA